MRGKHCHYTIILIKADFTHREGAYSHSVFTKIEMCTYHTGEILSVLIIVCIMRNNHSLLHCPWQCTERALRFHQLHWCFPLSLWVLFTSLKAGCTLQPLFDFVGFFTGGSIERTESTVILNIAGVLLGAGVPSSRYFFDTLLLLNC